MSPNVKKAIFITIGVATLVIVGIVIAKKLKILRVEDTPQGFNKLVEKAKDKHTGVYTWWEALPIEKQISIENTMDEKTLVYLTTEFGKNQLSADVKSILAKYGYVA